MPSVTLGKSFAECFWAFAECLWHSANLLYPVVSYALGAGPLFDVSDDSDYAQTLLGNLPGACIMTS